MNVLIKSETACVNFNELGFRITTGTKNLDWTYTVEFWTDTPEDAANLQFAALRNELSSITESTESTELVLVVGDTQVTNQVGQLAAIQEDHGSPRGKLIGWLVTKPRLDNEFADRIDRQLGYARKKTNWPVIRR